MKKNKKLRLYDLLKRRPFCNCFKKEKELYDAWCMRIEETFMNALEEEKIKGKK